MRQKILIIEDDPTIRDILILNLRENYTVLTSDTGAHGYISFTENHPDLILLDLGLPDTDGIDLLKSIREFSDIPVIIVSARQLEKDKVLALDAGADDYINKPFGNEELLARIRRSFRQNSPPPTSFAVGDFAIDFLKRRVTIKDEPIHLTPIEYEIVNFLCLSPGKVLTHEQILRRVWGPYEADNQILRVNMANIRRKAEHNPADPVYFLTDVGVGYRFADQDDIK